MAMPPSINLHACFKSTSPVVQSQNEDKDAYSVDSNMNGRVKSDGSRSSIGEDDDIATVEETFDETETSSGLANTSPNSIRGCSSPVLAQSNGERSFFNSRTTETSPTTAAVASVQAALSALQAGQMSLNQVKIILNPTPKLK